MSSRSWLIRAAQRLAAAGDLDARVDAELILCEALDAERGALRLRADEPLSEERLAQLEALLSRREAGEPLQYVLGTAWFMGLPFYVDARVLIPRQDTETLCEQALKLVRPGMAVLDLCTGSGALAVALKHRQPLAQVTAADISRNALDVARRNAERNGVELEFLRGDLFEAVARGEFQLIVCNPPYIRADEMGGLQEEVKREPALALLGGEDGLDFYRRIAAGYLDHLSLHGSLLLEVGQGQAAAVAAMFEGETRVAPDLNGIERVVIVKRMV